MAVSEASDWLGVKAGGAPSPARTLPKRLKRLVQVGLVHVRVQVWGRAGVRGWVWGGPFGRAPPSDSRQRGGARRGGKTGAATRGGGGGRCSVRAGSMCIVTGWQGQVYPDCSRFCLGGACFFLFFHTSSLFTAFLHAPPT